MRSDDNVLIYGSYLSRGSLQAINDIEKMIACRDALYTKHRFNPFKMGDEHLAFVGPVLARMSRLNVRVIDEVVSNFPVEKKRSVLSTLNSLPYDLRSLMTDPGFFVLGPSIVRMR